MRARLIVDLPPQYHRAWRRRHLLPLRGGRRGRQRLDVDADRQRVVIREVLRAAQHHFGHRAAGAGMRRNACLEQGRDIGRRPAAHARLHVVGERRRVPIQHGNDAARQRFGRTRRAQAVARGMAGGAVPQSFHQIAPAIPLHRLARVGLLDARLEIQRAPRGQQGAVVVGEVEFGWTVGLADGRHDEKVGI
ncbi:hypothetical protein G6F40_015734 [Rhizopus arrhizus]|nr:hypothetical protein G6F40_015734 [Rhizopus arrhizus]